MTELFVFFSLVSIFIAFMMFRNNWVYRTRMRWISDASNAQNFLAYDAAVSYHKMILRWWAWSSNIKDWAK